MRTILDNSGFSDNEPAPFAENLQEILMMLEGGAAEVPYFMFEALKLQDHPQLAEVVDQLVREAPARGLEVNLFSTTGWAWGTEVMQDRAQRDAVVIHAIDIEKCQQPVRC